MITSSMVLFLAVSSNVFGAVFTKLGATDLIANAISQVPLPDMGKLLLIMALDLRARLAFRVAGGDSGVPADICSGGGKVESRLGTTRTDDLVRRAGRG